MGRKVLGLDGDNPEALITVAEVIAERTRDADIDKDQRFGEATSMAQKATETVDTDLAIQAPQEKIDAAKAFLRSSAYSVLGTIEFKKENYAAAQENLQKSIDAFPSQPDPVVVLRLALAIDKQATAAVDRDKQEKLYGEALKVANRAVEMAKDMPAILTTAVRERDRLQKLTAGAAPAQPQTPPKN
jgi:tetratricopeptide (TPR) repeat protein